VSESSTVRTGLDRIDVPGAAPWRRGKVRDVYDLGDQVLVVASDRLSAYDSILPTPVPDKGRVLTAMSAWWFRTLAAAAPHHLVSTDRADFPMPFRDVAALEGRAMLCARAERVDIECVVRGALTGSGFREYRARGTLHGAPLPAGLVDGAPLDPPVFTPTTKAQAGHDEPIPQGGLSGRIGAGLAGELEARSLALFDEARRRAAAAGLVLADTKFEFGFVDGRLTLIDELLTPDSSRYWDAAAYATGRLETFDKQYVRDWLDRSGWDHVPPAPALPADVVAATRERYFEAARRLLGPAAGTLPA
jgi:phosphoribosylaminoimidazole-succinocarboxamide synthase